MKIDLITLFPEMCEAVLGESIIGRAQKSEAIEIKCHQLRDYAFDKHRRVDDTVYGGGMGMLLKCEPIALCYEAICEQRGTKPYFIYMSPQAKPLTQDKLKELSEKENICVLAGHYEGVDQRIIDEFIDEEVSIGDYVLTGARSRVYRRALETCSRGALERRMLHRGEPLQRLARVPSVHQAPELPRARGSARALQRRPPKG